MNLSAYIFHGIMVAAAASATIASSIGWGLDDPQRTEKAFARIHNAISMAEESMVAAFDTEITFRRRLGYA